MNTMNPSPLAPGLTRRDALKIIGTGVAVAGLGPVSYTHLTLPTIYSV